MDPTGPLIDPVGPVPQVASMIASSSLPLADSITSRRTAPDSRPTTPAIAGRSVAKVPWPRRRWARRRGGSDGSACPRPFFPRVLIPLVSLDDSVAQRIAVPPHPGVLVESVPPSQQVAAVAPQLAGQRRRRCPLSDAAKDHQDLRGPALRPLPDGPGPGVEDAAAGPALGVPDRRAVTAMNPQALPLSALGASPAVGVEECDEIGVAGVLIERVDQGEIDGRDLRAPSRVSLEDTTIRSDRQEAEHRVGLMSQLAFYCGSPLGG